MESQIFVKMKFIRNCVLFPFEVIKSRFLLFNPNCTFNASQLKRIETNPAFLLLVTPVSIVSFS